MRGDRAALLAQAQHGVVTAVDPVRGTVRVTLQPDGIETGDIPAATGLAAASLRICAPLELGTQVLMAPCSGDAEQFVVLGVMFDATVMPPVSPATGQPAQPGEFLAMAGQSGVPGSDGSAPAQAAGDGGAWFHLIPGGVVFGVGSTRITLADGTLTLSAGGQSAVLNASGLAVTADVTAGSVSLQQHVHGSVQRGSSSTGEPIG